MSSSPVPSPPVPVVSSSFRMVVTIFINVWTVWFAAVDVLLYSAIAGCV